jgi:hypothetical protein
MKVMETKPLSWAEEQRQLWIFEMLHIYGYINRQHLMKKFRISMPQASKDLNRFVKLHPNTGKYDVNRKCYILIN